MAVKLQHHNFLYCSASNNQFSQKPGIHLNCKNSADLDHLLCNWGYLRKKFLRRQMLLENNNQKLSYRPFGFRQHCSGSRKSRRMRHLFPFASADDGVTVNGSPQASTSTAVEDMRVKLDQSLQSDDSSAGLVQSLHDAARVFELAIKEQGSLSKLSWFSTVWLGIDKTAWVKELSYQASAFSLLQAASEISSRGDGRDRDINVFVQRSLLRQSAPLESAIREKISAKQPEADEWFWSEQIPKVVTSFVNYIESDTHFTAATALSAKAVSSNSGSASDISLLMLALTCMAAITKLGPAKISCSQFFSMILDNTGRLMDMLVNFVPIPQAYQSIKEIGLRREFLVHFGPRAAASGSKNSQCPEEVIFWIDLVQKQLQRAIDRERIWSRLTTSESIEVLERDLAIFGFFIALGRSSQLFLSANGFDVVNNPLEGFIRYLVGGSVLYYPQLSAINSYQLYVEVVCEELDWLLFYPGSSNKPKHLHSHNNKQEGPPDAKAIPQVFHVCSYWMQSFIKYSEWLENPSNIKAARFLSRGHIKLKECMEEMGIQKNDALKSKIRNFVERTGSGTYSSPGEDLDSFNKALESVEGALIRLEELFRELHVSSSDSGKENLKAACSDLERIRKLKKEAEFLEVSFRAKAASLQQGNIEDSCSSNSEQPQFSKVRSGKSANVMRDGGNSNARGMWSFLFRRPTWKPETQPSSLIELGNGSLEQTATGTTGVDGEEPSEIHRFKVIRNELRELEKRVQSSANQSEYEEVKDDITGYDDEDAGGQLLRVQKQQTIIENSFDKLKETTMDVLQGTQLLAIDVAASMALLKRVLIGDELTEKEKKGLRRTLTDLASVVPIGFLMLLPVTAVGHAAMLAAIQRYVPALIPSTYGPERLDLLRQLEKVKELEPSEVSLDGSAEETE
ncbi:hypothetical protein RJ641_027944 [Dillenia turbinata]|uniref:Letm1 RBD domain-containing protein n=1 Tax=Dillenia turbinata TaxID=194707 RepID=A0AAN8WB13_9MAGN